VLLEDIEDGDDDEYSDDESQLLVVQGDGGWRTGAVS
jgi:hypothetical protein